MFPQALRVESFSAGYKPGPNNDILTFSVAVGVATKRLDQLITIPALATGSLLATRVPNHVLLQLQSTAGNSIFFTADATTAAVVGAPSLEIKAGETWVFENAVALLSIPNNPTQSAISLIATAPTTLTAVFFD